MMNNSGRVILNTGFFICQYAGHIGSTTYRGQTGITSIRSVDYGIYSIIAGLVAMFAFYECGHVCRHTTLFYLIPSELATLKNSKEIFYHSVLLHLLIGIIILILLEIGGNYYIIHILQAQRPGWRQRILLHCITFSTLANIITVPYEADINANENLGAIALINILDSLMKLGTAIYIGFHHKTNLSYMDC